MIHAFVHSSALCTQYWNYYLSPLRRIYGPTTPDADDADGIMITTTLSLFFFFSFFFFAYLSCSLSLSFLTHKSTMLIPDQHLKEKFLKLKIFKKTHRTRYRSFYSGYAPCRRYSASTLDKLDEIRSIPPRLHCQ